MVVQAITIPRSIKMLNRKMGIVYLVGIAARFVTNVIDIAISASMNSTMFDPERTTAKTVRGVRIQPCAVNAIPNHMRRFSC